MTFFGVDGSHYQKGLKIKWLKTQGYSYFMAKCTQGTGFVDSEYDNFRLQADACNMPFVAYHFLEHGNGANQAKHLAEHIGDKKIPVMVDFEPTKFSHPTWRDYTDFRKEAKAQGLNLINNLVYLPKWYWSEIKTPKLDSLTLVQSYYPYNNHHTYGSVIYKVAGGDKSHGWNAFGRNSPPEFWQFTSNGKIKHFNGTVDVQAFRGSQEELNNLVGKPRPKPPAKNILKALHYLYVAKRWARAHKKMQRVSRIQKHISPLKNLL